jgi:hypothetical protein
MLWPGSYVHFDSPVRPSEKRETWNGMSGRIREALRAEERAKTNAETLKQNAIKNQIKWGYPLESGSPNRLWFQGR